MYKRFFGLKRNPFELSPDPYFLFETQKHNEALACLVHGVMRRKGFLLLTGEVGTGKTLVVRCLLEILRRKDVAFANVFNPSMQPLDFLHYVVADLGVRSTTHDKASLLLDLNNFLISRYRRGLTAALIVDEGQQLNEELLEEIRLLSNLEASQQKLLQIVLVGQPELDRMMDSHDLRQLKQRIALRCQLDPLQEEETKEYILSRMSKAGTRLAVDIFPDESLATIHLYSRGIPRLINSLCENGLISAYAQRSTSVSCDIIHEVAEDLRIDVLSGVNESMPAATPERSTIASSLLRLADALERSSAKERRRLDAEAMKVV